MTGEDSLRQDATPAGNTAPGDRAPAPRKRRAIIIDLVALAHLLGAAFITWGIVLATQQQLEIAIHPGVFVACVAAAAGAFGLFVRRTWGYLLAFLVNLAILAFLAYIAYPFIDLGDGQNPSATLSVMAALALCAQVYLLLPRTRSQFVSARARPDIPPLDRAAPSGPPRWTPDHGSDRP